MDELTIEDVPNGVLSHVSASKGMFNGIFKNIGFITWEFRKMGDFTNGEFITW